MAYHSAVSRLSVLSHHLGAGEDAPCLARQDTAAAADESVRPAPGGGKGTLTVLDNRTGKKYTVSHCGHTLHSSYACSDLQSGSGQGLACWAQ
jgi:citrate synthase